MPLVRMMATGWNVVFGAEHQTVESVTCNGEPVDVKEVGVMAGGRRTVHALKFLDLTLGSVTVQVRRGTRTVSESLELHTFQEGSPPDLTRCS
ncbi:hypothetical protein ACWCXB_34080 [Streptomyces sp. NPDC001514]